jgi:hypothetical protein
MKQLFTLQNICVASGTMLALAVVWFSSSANEAATTFVVVAVCTAVAAGTFFTWAIKSLLGWR